MSDGFGYFMVDPFPDHKLKRLNWTNQSITLLPNQDVYIYFNSSGILTSNSSYPLTPSNILLGRVKTNGSIVEFIENIPMNTHHFGNHLDLFLRNAFGPVYASGSIVTENTTNLKIDITAGEYFFSGNRITPSSGTAINFQQLYRDGAGGYIDNDTDTINNTHYDDGTGTLQSLTTGYYAKHDLYIAGTGTEEFYYLVISQQEYDSLAAAQTGATNTPPPYLRAASVRVASIIIQEGTPSIQNIIDTRPALGFKAEALSAASDHGSLTGLLDDDHTQYLLVNGNRSMTDNLNMGSNNITNVGTINSVTIQSHASRHLPNGADALDTAAPSTTLDGTTSNSVGIANSLSRSDHTHAIALATGSISGLMSFDDKNKLNNVEPNAKDDQNASEVPYDNSGSSLSATDVKTALDELDSEKQNKIEKGQPNGYASLDSGGKIPESQLPTKMMEFEGNWDASGNLPSLADTDMDKQGTTYRVSVAGTVDFGSGPITFDIGDWVYNNGNVWQRGDNVDQVTSVFGRTGGVTAQSGDYTGLQVTYTRADGSKKDIQANSDDLENALNDIDDLKLSRSGSQAMTGNLDMGGNTITNVGNVDGVDVSGHASRHLPNGADPITTASAVNVGSANSEGTANSLARADHVHNVFPVFQFQSVETIGNLTTTSGTPQQAQTLTTPSLPNGTYKIEWYFEQNVNSVVSNMFFQVQLNNTDNLATAEEELQDTANYMSRSGFAIRNLSGINTVDIDVWNDGGSTVTARRRRIIITRVG